MNKSFMFMLIVLLCSFASASQNIGIEFHETQGSGYFLDDGFTINVLHPDVIKLNTNISVYGSFYDERGKILDKDSAECLLGILSPNLDRVVIYNESDMIFLADDTIQVTLIDGSFFNETGSYLYNYNCDDGAGTVGGYFHGHFEVTATGHELGIPDVMVYGLLLLFFCSCIFWYNSLSRKTNWEKMKGSIFEKYKQKNIIKAALGTLFYGLVKKGWAIYYFLGFFVMLTLYSLINYFNVILLMEVFNVLLNVYSVLMVVIALIVLGDVQKFAKNMIDDVKKEGWGVNER